jgi:hypothetical protein
MAMPRPRARSASTTRRRGRNLCTTAIDARVADARAAWHIRELVAELQAVARAKGRELEIPDPLFFRDLLEVPRRRMDVRSLDGGAVASSPWRKSDRFENGPFPPAPR